LIKIEKGQISLKKIISLFIVFALVFANIGVLATVSLFDDTKTHWASEEIELMASKGVVNGVGERKFKPDDYISRAEFVAITVRLLELTPISYKNKVGDVYSNEWYANTVQTAIDAGIIDENILRNNLFLPNQNITRQEMASVIMLAYKYKNLPELPAQSIDKFSDKDEIEGWAKDYVCKALGVGIIKGMTDSTFEPLVMATRAQSVVIIKRLLQSFDSKPEVTPVQGDGMVAISETPNLAKEEIEKRFPVYQAGILNPIAGPLSSFSLLAKYDTQSPDEIYVKYIALGDQNPTLPFDAMKYVCVYDYSGKTVAYYDFSECKKGETKDIIIKVPKSEPGIWRVIVSGGSFGDRVEIGMPQTTNWGISANMKLGITETTPKTGYIYLPRTTEKFSLFTYGVGAISPEFDVYDSTGNLIGRPAYETARKRGELYATEGVKDCVWSVTHQGKMPSAIIINSAPNLICPTKEAALVLKGGTLEASGLIVGGAIQARARNAMVDVAKDGFDVKLDWPDKVPDDLKNIQLESLIFGAYGGLSNINYVFETQVIDPKSPYYGCFMYKEFEKIPEKTWQNYVYTNRYNITESLSLAVLYSYPAKLNVTYKNKQILNRAIISAFTLITQLNSENIIRQNDMATNEFPMADFFFQYPSLAEAYFLLKDDLSPGISQIWRDGLITIGDSIGNYTSYQPNQWSNIMAGHLNTYLATGEKRFLDRFELMIKNYPQYRVGNKMSQHPAGYFMENLGPDGNYEQMNLECLVSNYYDYKKMNNAKPELVEIMRDSIARSLEFQKFYWLPQTDGKVVSPNSIASRTLSTIANEGHPGTYAAYPEFPLAAARYALSVMPSDGLGAARVMSYIANNEQWQKNILEWGISSKGDGFAGVRRTMLSQWPIWLYKSYSIPTRVEPAKLPIEEKSGIWELPGQIAFKTGDLYSLIFYGADEASLNSQRSGAPIAVWTKDTGNVILSMKNTKDYTKIDIPNAIHTCVVGKQNGNVFQTGTENGTLNWIEKGKVFEITSKLKNIDASLLWHYEIEDNGYKMSVSLKSETDVENLYLNLPIYRYEDNAKISEPNNGKLSFALNGSTVNIQWPSGVTATMGSSIKESYIGKNVQSLKIPLSNYGRPLEVKFNVTK